MYLLQHCKVAKLNRLHQIFRCIIIKVTSNLYFYKNSHAYNKDSASCLMKFEIATLFTRFAIKHSFQNNFLLNCLPKRTFVLENKNSRFLWREFLKLGFFS